MIAVTSVSSGAVPICPARLVAGRAGIGTIWFITNPVAVVSQGLFPPPLGIKTCISLLFLRTLAYRLFSCQLFLVTNQTLSRAFNFSS